jgi:hypothetical protein
LTRAASLSSRLRRTGGDPAPPRAAHAPVRVLAHRCRSICCSRRRRAPKTQQHCPRSPLPLPLSFRFAQIQIQLSPIQIPVGLRRPPLAASLLSLGKLLLPHSLAFGPPTLASWLGVSVSDVLVGRCGALDGDGVSWRLRAGASVGLPVTPQVFN